jgi:WD40 repeat protein
MFNIKHNFVMLALLLSVATIHASELSTEPMLRLETGMHTAMINRLGVDAAERFLLTASDDKTLRLWDLHTGDLLKTYRVPIGADNEGKLYSGAISPDGEWVAGTGWTKASTDSHNVYLFNRATGRLFKRLSGLEERIIHLCFSYDGQYLGASLKEGKGIQVWNTQGWQLVFSDTDYAGDSYWCDFDQQNRLVTSSWDGYLRLYSTTSTGGFSLVTKSEVPGGLQPFSAVFSPTGDKIALGFQDSTSVNVLDGHNLAFLYAPDTMGIENGNLMAVAWSQDGNSLYAGGRYDDGSGINPVLHWSQAGQGNYTKWQASLTTIMDIHSLKNGDIVYGAQDPTFAILDNVGSKIVERKANLADFRGIFLGHFAISHDGTIIQFGFELRGERPARFSLSEQSLVLNPQQDSTLTPPDTSSLNITWKNTLEPKLNGSVLSLAENEFSRSLAIAPDKSKFLLGAGLSLRLFDTNGQQLWRIDAPSIAWGVNISGDGKKAVAAFGDGTIRWYNLENGEELLTFFPHQDGKRWIAWTVSGYYMSSADNTDNIIGWHVNEGKDKVASFFPVGALFASYKRPDIVKKILVTLDEDEAIRLSNLEKEGIVEPPINVADALAEVGDKYEIDLEPSRLGKAIIVAASGEHDENTLFSYSNEFTTEMYRFLHHNGFSDDDIIYLNPYPPVVPATGYVDVNRQDFPMREPKKELQEAVAQASKTLKAGQQFLFYLHGRANQDLLHLRYGSVEMSAQEIKALLAPLPKDVEQIIILDTCYSGSFLDELAGVKNRIVVTSADADSCLMSTVKAGSFSYTLIRELRRGQSVGEAFESAERASRIESKGFDGEQRPQLDDTQDGFYASDDGLFSRRTYIGGKKVHGSLPPEITDMQPTIQLAEGQTTAKLWVKAIPDFNGMKKVRAILVNEHDEVIQYQGEGTNFTRRELTLLPNYDLQRYEIDYDNFHTAHDWKILYQAQSMEGDWSEIFTGSVTYEGTLAENAALTPSQGVYHDGDNLRVTVPLLPAGQAQYVGIALPDGTIFVLTDLNGFAPFDNVTLPVFQGGELAIEMPVSADMPRGEYILYLLRIPVGVDLLTHPEQWMVGVSSFKVE